MSRKVKKLPTEDGLDIYLKAIGKIPLITAKEEAELAMRVKKGEQQALEKLTKSNLRFVVLVAKQYQNRSLSLGDLINEGNIGLIKAARRFDETRGFKFISYAVWWIRQAILQALAEQSRIVRIPLNRVETLHKISKIISQLEQEYGREPSPDEIAAEMTISRIEVEETLKIAPSHLSLDATPPDSNDETNNLFKVVEDDLQLTSDEALLNESLRLEIERALNTLSAREAEVINLYFGLNQEKALILEEIGVKYNLTRERVRQIKNKALKKLRDKNQGKRLRAFVP